MRFRLPIACLTIAASVSLAADRATITGKVTDVSGKPLENATVMVYKAGVKQGYSTYCPTCYTDCGKRALTDGAGSFTIQNLSPDLWFELLVIREGYTSAFIEKINPSQGPARTAALKPRLPVDDPTRVVRGRVVDSKGEPVRDTVVEPIGISMNWEGRGPVSQYGTVEGLEPITVTNPKGDFEIAHDKAATGFLLRVQPRGMAQKLIALAPGTDRKTITVVDGALVRGRLVENGKGVAGAEIGLIARNRGGYGANLAILGNPYSEIRIGTQEDGSFHITNVPVGVEWYIYGKMGSIAARGATQPAEFATTRDLEEVDVGDIQIKPGHRLSGKVTLSDGAAIPEGMRVILSADRVWDSQTVTIGRDGSFEFAGLPAGNHEISPSVRGYQWKGEDRTLRATVERDVKDFEIVLQPASRR